MHITSHLHCPNGFCELCAGSLIVLVLERYLCLRFTLSEQDHFGFDSFLYLSSLKRLSRLQLIPDRPHVNSLTLGSLPISQHRSFTFPHSHVCIPCRTCALCHSGSRLMHCCASSPAS